MDNEKKLENSIREHYKKKENHMEKYIKITNTNDQNFEIQSCTIPRKTINISEITISFFESYAE